MPGWLGRTIQKSAKGTAENCKKKYDAGQITAEQYAQCLKESADAYEYGVAHEQRKKSEGIGGALKQVGKIAGATVGTLVTTGNPLAAGAAFVSAAEGVKAEAAAEQVKYQGKVGSTTTRMSFLGNLISGIGDKVVNFSQTGVGQAATGILTNYIANLATPKQQGPSQSDLLAQLVSLQGTPLLAQSTQPTTAQNAVFSGSGISVNVPLPGENKWWSSNKMWAIPAMIGMVGMGIIFGLVSLFTRKRR